MLPTVFLCPAGTSGCATQRQIKLTVDPDTCAPSEVVFQSADPTIAPPPATVTVSLHNDQLPVTIQAGAASGSTTITATVFSAPQVPVACSTDADCQKAPAAPTCHNGGCTLTASASFAVDVVGKAVPQCMGTASTAALHGGDPPVTLGAASISLPLGANNPDQGSFLWGVAPFPATIDCTPDINPMGYEPLGPAITFGPESLAFPREVPMAVPVNPALVPAAASLRHVRVAYSGPAFKHPSRAASAPSPRARRSRTSSSPPRRA
jgi:hypothetical protein